MLINVNRNICSKHKLFQKVFKVIDGQLTNIFKKTQNVSTGFRTATTSLNEYVGAFNRLNSTQSFGEGWSNFLDGMGKLNPNLPAYFQDLAKQGASAQASIQGMYTAMLNGNTSGIGNVRTIVSVFNQMDPEQQKAFASAVGQTNARLGSYLGNLNGAKASLRGYGAQLVGTTAKTVALTVAATALNAVISMGISLVISLAMKGITALINKTQDAIDKAKEASQAVTEQEKTVNDYIDKIVELRNKLEDNNLTEQESIDIKKNLSDIQSEIIDKYGDEAKGLDLVTGSIEDQVNALYRLNKAKYDEQYSLNKEGYDAAKEQVRNATASLNMDRATANGLTGMFASWDGDVQQLRKFIESTYEKYGFNKKESIFGGRATWSYELTGDMYTVDEALNNVYNDIKTYSQDGSEEVKNAANVAMTYISQVRRDWSNKTLDDNEELYAQWLKYESDYSDDYIELVRKKANLEYAIDSKNAEDIVKAKSEFETEYAKATEKAIKAGDTDVAKYLEKTFSDTVKGLDDIKTSSDNVVPSVSSLNETFDILKDLLKDIIKYSEKYKSAMTNILTGTALTVDEVAELLEIDPTLFDKFTKTDKGWTISIDALKESNEKSITEAVAKKVGGTKDELEKGLADGNTQLEKLQKKRNGILFQPIPEEEKQKQLKSIDEQIQNIKGVIENAENGLSLTDFYTSLFNFSELDVEADVLDKVKDSVDDTKKKVDGYNSGITKLNKAIQTLNEGNSLSYDDMMGLVELYPQLYNKAVKTADGYTFEVSALQDVSKQAYKTRDDCIDAQITEAKATIEQTKLRMEAYSHEIALISSAYAYKHALETGLFENFKSAKDTIELMEELVKVLEGYKTDVLTPDTSSTKSKDKEITDALQNQIDYYTTLIDAIEALADKEIETLEKEKDAIDKKIDKLEDEKDALKDKNDEQQRELDLIDAKNNLDKAKKQKVFVYKEGEGLVQVQDEKAVKDAQKNLDDVKDDIEEARIDKEIDAYKKQQDGIDTQIDAYNEYKDSFTKMESNAKDQLAIEQAKKTLGTDENGLLNLSEKDAQAIRDGLATAIYNKDVNDNKDNDKYVSVSLDDFLKGLGANVTPQQFQAMAKTTTNNTPISAPITNSTVNNAQSIVNNKSVTLNNTFNVYDSKDGNDVVEKIKSYMNKTLRTAINSIK